MVSNIVYIPFFCLADMRVWRRAFAMRHRVICRLDFDQPQELAQELRLYRPVGHYSCSRQQTVNDGEFVCSEATGQ